jgi:hypothetical protein
MATTLELTDTPTRKRKYSYFTRAKNKLPDSDPEFEVTEPELRTLLMNYSIDPHEYDDSHLFRLTILMFRHYDLFEEFHFNETTTINFIRIVRDMYNPENYFHNFKHAWGVMHMCFHILIHGAEQYVDKFDILTILIAALCHDVGHPGNSNAFEMATKSTVSKIYAQKNEICVLEKFHAKITHILLKAEVSILATLNPSEKERFHQQIDFIIMGTDMAKHVMLVGEATHLVDTILHSNHDSSILTNSNKSSIGSDDSTDLFRIEFFPSNSSNASNNSTTMKNSTTSSNNTKATTTTTHSIRTSSNTTTVTTTMNNKIKKKAASSANDFFTVELSTPTETTTLSLDSTSSITTTTRRPPSSQRSRTTTITNTTSNTQKRSHQVSEHLLTPSTRSLFTRILVHSADIGAQTESLPVALKWVDRVYSEYRNQAEKEISLGIMTSPFIHDLKEDSKVFSTQFSFIEDTVEPIWTALTTILPDLQFALHQLQANKNHYKKLF